MRRVAVAVAVAVSVAACSSAGETAEPAPPAPTVDDIAPEEEQPSGDPGATPDPAGATTVPGPGATVPATEPAPPTTTTDVGGAPDPTAPVPAPGPVGGYAARYLRPEASASIVVHVAAQGGAEPRPATIERLVSVLGQVSGKPVAVTTSALAGDAPRQWRTDELVALADEAGMAQSRDRAVLHVLFLHGGFAENERAVGVAVRGDVAAVFADRVEEAAGVLGNRSAVEEAVTVHELGHLLGLVDLVLDTGREDPDHPGHSANRDSVMYHAVESTLLGSILSGGPPRDFDQADVADLARIRDGAP